MTPGALVASNLQLSIDNVYDGGVGGVVTDNPKSRRSDRDAVTREP
jgi:hypothetical protein